MFATMSGPTSLFDQLERLQREIVGTLSGPQPGSIRAVAAGSFPPVNVGRSEKSIEVYAFAPGLEPSKIDVTLDRGVLRLSGERQRAGEPREGSRTFYARERLHGSFSRAISLPEDVDPALVGATYKEGVLRVSIGLRENAKPQRIAIQ